MKNLKPLNNDLSVLPLGQVGYVFFGHGRSIVIDPYLTDAVERAHGPHLARQIPVVLSGSDVPVVDVLLLTHDHDDHTDPESIAMFYHRNRELHIIAPNPVQRIIRNHTELSGTVMYAAFDGWKELDEATAVAQVPSAHPDLVRDADGTFCQSGFLIRSGETVVYHAGDTSVAQEIIDAIDTYTDHVDFAFLPVNESNFFRTREGIIGNLTVREAFQFCEEIGAATLVPTHWDLFAGNGLFPEELNLLYRKLKPNFDLLWLPVVE